VYSFRTIWRVDASPEHVWAEIERVMAGESAGWWPAFRVERPAPLERGAALGVVVRAPFGYRLRIVLTLTDVEPRRSIAARSAGDLEGGGGIEITPEGGGSAMRFVWDVAVRKRWMRVASPILRPVFALAHGLVMRAGERGLRRAVASGARKTANPAPGSRDPRAAG